MLINKYEKIKQKKLRKGRELRANRETVKNKNKKKTETFKVHILHTFKHEFSLITLSIYPNLLLRELYLSIYSQKEQEY